MSFSAGTRLGPYEIQSGIGANRVGIVVMRLTLARSRRPYMRRATARWPFAFVLNCAVRYCFW
jgi:hypothetical protein